jgi:hypothetical protein
VVALREELVQVVDVVVLGRRGAVADLDAVAGLVVRVVERLKERLAGVALVGARELARAVVPEGPGLGAAALVLGPGLDASVRAVGVIELRDQGSGRARGEVLDLLERSRRRPQRARSVLNFQEIRFEPAGEPDEKKRIRKISL